MNALVFDLGTSTTRAGYAGEDTPRALFPTCYGYLDQEQTADGDVVMSEANEAKRHKYYIGDNRVNTWRANMEVRNPVKDGMGNWLTE